MYGKWVTLDLDEGIVCHIWVPCMPTTPPEELRERAIAILRKRLVVCYGED